MHPVQVPGLVIGLIIGTIVYAILLRVFARKLFSWLNVAFWAVWMAVCMFSIEYFKVGDFFTALTAK